MALYLRNHDSNTKKRHESGLLLQRQNQVQSVFDGRKTMDALRVRPALFLIIIRDPPVGVAWPDCPPEVPCPTTAFVHPTTILITTTIMDNNTIMDHNS